MDLLDIIATVLMFSLLGLVASILSRRLPIPETLLMVIAGFLFALCLPWLEWDTGIRAYNFQNLVLFVLLPVLIFEAAYNFDTAKLKQYFPAIFIMATVGLLLSTIIVAVILFYGIGHPVGFPVIAALLAGVVISATDPVAVVSQLKTLKAPKDLSTLIEGESLFNDATAIVVFSIFLSVALGQAEPTVASGVLQFFKVFFGGIFVGYILGRVAAKIAVFMAGLASVTIFLSITLAYGSFYLAEHILHLSGVMAVLCAAIVFKKHGKFKKLDAEGLHVSWELLSYIANVLVFVLLGLVITLDMFTERWIAMLLAIVGALIARLFAIYISTYLSRVFACKIDRRYPLVMVWGGLRGAVTIALVLSLPTELDYWWTIQSIGFGMVLFTLIFQATTTAHVLRARKIV